MWNNLVTATVFASLLSLVSLFQQDVPTLEWAERERFAARYDKAADLYAKVLLANPRDPEAHYGRVFSLIQAKRSREGYEAADEAMRQAPQAAGALAAAGIAAYRRGEIPAAEKLFEAARKADPQHHGALRGLALSYRAISKFRSASQLLHLALKAKPGDPLLIEGYANGLQGDEHIAGLERALGIVDPTTEHAKQLRAHVQSDRALGSRVVSELASPYERATIKLQRVSAGPNMGWRVGLRVQLNEKDGITLLLDTGCAGINVSPGTASRARLEKLSDEPFEARGIGDGRAQDSSSYLASSLRIGSVTLRNVPVGVFQAAQGPNYDGIIGTNVFSAFLVTIDFPKMEFQLEPRPNGAGSVPAELQDAGPLAEGFTRAVRLGSHFMVPTLVNHVKDAKLFLLDSGAGVTLIDSAVAGSVANVSRAPGVVLGGVQGRVNRVSRATDVELVFAGFREIHSDILAMDLGTRGDLMGMALSGIIGIPTLSALRVTLDYLEGSVRFEYK